MTDWNLLARLMILAGVLLILSGTFLLLAGKLPLFGNLPGDIHLERKGFSLYVPLTTCIVLSILLTLSLRFLSRR